MTTSKDHKATTREKLPTYIRNLDQIPQLSESERRNLLEVTENFAFRANRYYLGLIDWDDPNDPIRKLIIPHEEELSDWGDLDACNENSVTVRKGVQHKYASTVLMLVNEVCASFCRYCFRKRLFMNDNDEITYDIEEGLKYIREHEEVNNVLLTGGDPMILPTRRIEKILSKLREIEHVKIIRIGTKMPAFNPFRFIDDPELLNVFKKYSLPDRRIYLMCHFDHPKEITEECLEGLRLIQDSGVICMNQNPIMRGISDDPEIMAQLWNLLSFLGISQYYIFQGRPTAGNKPFEVPIVEAYFKIEEAKRRCSGLAKRAKYVMSHESGKIEVVGVDEGFIYMKYHRAKEMIDEQRFVVCYRDERASWYDQLKPVEGFEKVFYEAGLLPAAL
jgi:lysine 2,3-aminomutase